MTLLVGQHDKKGWSDFEDAHIVEISGWDKEVKIKTLNNDITFDEDEVSEIFNQLLQGNSYTFTYSSTLSIYIQFNRL
jgi:hypothetical protein